MSDIKSALNFAREGKANNFKDSISALLKDRIIKSISNMKSDVARNMFKKGEKQGE